MKLDRSLQYNIEQIKKTFGNSDDLVVREMKFGTKSVIHFAFIYLDGMADQTAIYRLIHSIDLQIRQSEQQNDTQLIDQLQIPIGDSKTHSTFDTLLKAVLLGNTIILVDLQATALSVETVGYESRSVSEPQSQTVVRGPQDGFTENLQTNITLIRRRIKDANLWLERREVGKVTKTSIAVMYINGLAKDSTIKELRARLKKIDIDGILESNYIEELIQDKRKTVFPTVENTERPDIVAAALLEGKIAILIDGTPFVLLVPVFFTQFFQAAEDYYHRSDFGVLRILRYLAIFISLLAPGVYIALTTFHQEMLPTEMLISIAAQREGIPFPAFIEALIMEITFEFLREAGVRMPRAVGSAISIVGALVLGQSAVQANLVSPAMVIVVSITAIAGFIFPSYDMGISLRILRFIFMGLAASFGLYGIFIGLMALLLHLCHIESFGVPYMSPFAPYRAEDQNDAIIRVPWWKMYTRPSMQVQNNLVRQSQDSSKQEGSQQNEDQG